MEIRWIDRARARVVWAALGLAALSGPPLSGQEIDLLVSPGKLSRVHGAYSELSNCGQCHTARTKSVDAKCLACHEELARRIQTGRGFHQDKKTGCPTCHPDHHGPDFALIDWKPGDIDHAKTGYPLTGKHALVKDCQKCHNARTSPPTKTTVSYLIRETRCGFCHEDAHRGQFRQDCSACHSPESSFKEARFDHERAAFRLTGAHRNLACQKCHPEKKWKGLAFAGCADCHRDNHKPSFGRTCAQCHADGSWKVRSLNHTKSKFPLDGQHARLKCEKCHTNGKLDKIPGARCRDCHAKDPHAGQFQDDCQSCHQTTGFKKAVFDHRQSRYPLAGKHAPVACGKCHVAEKPGGVVRYKPLPTGCAECHRDPHEGQFEKDCAACHSAQGFGREVSPFDHQKDSSYKLEGAHAAAKCEGCHKKESAASSGGPEGAVRYRPIKTDCLVCHEDEHARQLNSDCRTCHNLEHFKPAAGFSHQRTSFSLKIFHESVACERCHPRSEVMLSGKARSVPRYKPTAQECQDCHRPSEHAKTDFPLTGKHVDVGCGECHTAQAPRLKRLRESKPGPPPYQDCQLCHLEPHKGMFKQACTSCHTSAGWANASRSFHINTPFPLEGRHLTAPCASCHLEGVVKGTPKKCFDCHWARRRDDRYGTKLGAECEDCHRPMSWTAVLWDHKARTGVALNAGHRAVGCESCHKDQTFKGTSLDCFSCHRQAYSQTKEPDHAAAGFPTNCEICHRAADASWNQGSFNHGSVYPLVGGHRQASCAECHKGKVYKGTPRDCYGCHRAEYDQTKSPNHAASGLGTACEACHRPTDPSWTGGTFSHGSVYALVGLHAAAPCTACHKNNIFKGTPRDCYGCHRADYDQTKNPNHAASGLGTACEACHRAADSSWNQGSLNHNSIFPLVGVHAAAPCAACHLNNIYKGTPRDCYGCHRANYDQAANPNHRAAGFPTSCESCHRPTDSSWTQGTFNHTWFPITSGRHSGNNCSACHPNSTNYKSYTCLTCHARSATDSEHRSVSGYVYNSPNCYSCHPLGRVR